MKRWIILSALALLACGCACQERLQVAKERRFTTFRPIPFTVGNGALFRNSPFSPVVDETVRAIRAKTAETQGNYVHILNSGDDALLARIHLIRNATRSICVQTFIWTNDEVGRFVMHELIEAAKRGVHVRVIADHFVSHKDPDVVAFLATANPNLEIKHYRPAAKRIRPSRLQIFTGLILGFKSLNQRMHNKIMVFDDVVAITGGRNIENTYFNRSTKINFKDRDVLVVGPVVPGVRKSFEKYWKCRHVVSAEELVDVARAIREDKFKRFRTHEDFNFGELCESEYNQASDADLIERRFTDRLTQARRVEFVADKPGKNRAWWLRGGGALTRRLGKTFGKVQGEMVIQSPYFVLGRSTQRFFAKLRKKNPDLRVIVSTNSFGSTDNTFAYSANYRLRSSYIEGLGFETYEYKPHPADLRQVYPAFDEFAERAQEKIDKGEQDRGPFLCIHAKSAVMDRRISYIGSYNLDPRSANLNTEVGFLIDDEEVAKQLRDDMLNDCRPENSWVIAKRQMPLGTDVLNGMVEGLMLWSPIDLWPIRNTTSFGLRPGKPAVPTSHPDFYDNYKDTGGFPGAPPGLSMKEITTRILKTVGPLAVPIM